MNLETSAVIGGTRHPIYSLRQLLLYALKLGTVGFGGPLALVAYMYRDLVEQRHWISEADYKEGLALAQVMPGPLRAQLAIRLGNEPGGRLLEFVHENLPRRITTMRPRYDVFKELLANYAQGMPYDEFAARVPALIEPTKATISQIGAISRELSEGEDCISTEAVTAIPCRHPLSTHSYLR